MLHESDMIPTGKFKTFMNFYNSFVKLCLLINLCLNKQTVTQFYDNILYIKRINIHLKMQNNTLKYFNQVAKTCEKVLRGLRLQVEHVFNNKSESSKNFILK